MQESERPVQSVHPVARVLVSGASGMLGGALRLELSARGKAVLQLVRRNPLAANEVRWDATTPLPPNEAAPIEDCIGAIHLSGASLAGQRWTTARREELRASRVGSTAALAQMLARLRQPPRTLVVASAVGFYGNRGDEVLDESSVAGEGFLAELCRQWEAAAEVAHEAGIRVVHARFGVVLGRQSGALRQMLPIFRLGLGGTLGDGHQWMSWVSLEDAVAAILFALDTPGLAGPVNVTAPHPVTNAEFTRVLAKQLRRPAVLPAPAWALRFAFGSMADEALLASTRAVPSRLLAAGLRFRQPRVHEALAAAIPTP